MLTAESGFSIVEVILSYALVTLAILGWLNWQGQVLKLWQTAQQRFTQDCAQTQWSLSDLSNSNCTAESNQAGLQIRVCTQAQKRPPLTAFLEN